MPISLVFTMHGLLKLLQQQTIFVSASSWLDVGSVFNLLLLVLFVTSREFNKKRFRSVLSVPDLAGCIVIGHLVQLCFLCFYVIVNGLYSGTFLGHFLTCTLLQYRYLFDISFLAVLKKILDCYCSYRKLIQFLVI